MVSTNWYVIKVVSGQERKLAEHLNQQIEMGRIKNVIRFLCPTEKEFVTVRNKKILREKVIYNGYLYFETSDVLNEDQLKEFDTYPNIISMLGEKKPTLLNKKDVERIIKDDALNKHNDMKQNKYKINETISIIDGPFKGFNGDISNIYENTLEVQVPIFGRKNTITVETDHVKKIE